MLLSTEQHATCRLSATCVPFAVLILPPSLPSNRAHAAGVAGAKQGAWWDRSVRNFGNLDEAVVPSVTARVRARDVEGLVSEVDKFAVWSIQQQRLRIVAPDEAMDFELSPRASDVLTVAALQVFCGRGS